MVFPTNYITTRLLKHFIKLEAPGGQPPTCATLYRDFPTITNAVAIALQSFFPCLNNRRTLPKDFEAMKEVRKPTTQRF